MKSKIIVALDYSDLDDANQFISKLDPTLCHLKVGKNMFTRFGPDFVRALIQKKFSVFLDLKFHDIPNTVADACIAAAQLGVWMVSVHTLGGAAMLQAARKAIDAASPRQRPLLIGVTLLTSLDEHDLKTLHISDSIESTVLNLATLAKKCGLDGVVCSAAELSMLRKTFGKDFLLITPGIRFENDASADQKRIATPEAALQAGADYLVMGRSMTSAKNPLETLKKICSF